MKKKRNTIAIVLSIVIIITIVMSSAMYYLFFDINRIKGEELITQSVSPNSTYTIEAYLNGGSATTDSAVLCTICYNNKDKKDRNIYWDYHCNEAVIEWVDDDTVIINGKTINDVTKDKYDFRTDKK